MSLDIDSALRLLLYGLWAPIFAIAAIYFTFRWMNSTAERRSRYYRQRESEDLRFLIRRLDDRFDTVSENLSRSDAFSPRLMEAVHEAIQESSAKSRSELERLVEYTIERLGKLTGPTAVIPASMPVTLSEQRQSLIREISHALFTPLSRIDAIATNVISTDPSDLTREKMEKAKSAVEICYAYLTAYRNVANVAGASSYWTPASLRSAITASAHVYCDNLNLHIDVNVDAPETVRSVSNIFMLAVLLPLIENGAEACREGDAILIAVRDSEEEVRAIVSNPIHDKFPGDEILKAGFTTKLDSSSARMGHNARPHEGLGLTIVQNLLASTAGARLRFNASGDRVDFMITIPGRSEQARLTEPARVGAGSK